MLERPTASPGRPLSFNRGMKLFGNIWIWGTEWKVCIWGEHLEKKNASRCVWAKMLFKCKLNVRYCPALQAFGKSLIAGESEVLAAACRWRSGCRTVPADVPVHSLWVTVRFVVGESVTLFSLVQAKLFNSSCRVFLPDVALQKQSFEALKSRQAVFW